MRTQTHNQHRMEMRCLRPQTRRAVSQGVGAAFPCGAPPAFTMLEMLVAMAATMIMILFLNQIFTSMSGAVSAGKGTSLIVENARAIIPQLTKDAEEMVGPSDNGILVITNKLLKGDLNGDGVVDKAAGEWDYRLSRGSMRPIAPGVRTDQVIWIRNVARELPRSPANSETFDNYTGAAVGRVWYGHGSRADPNGNEFVAGWVLCRHLLFLDPAAATRVVGAGTTANTWYSDGVDRLSKVRDAGAGTPHPQLDLSATNGLNAVQLFHGIVDVAARDLVGDTNAVGIVSNVTPKPVPAVTSGAARNDFVLFVTATPVDPNPSIDDWGYWHRALRFMYVFDKFLVNPAVGPDNQVQTWEAGQMHALLADHVVDFTVEFAGDYINGLVPPAASPTNPGPLLALTPGSDGNIDQWSDGSLIWYGREVLPPSSIATTPPVGAFATQDSDTTSANPIFARTPQAMTVQGVDRVYAFRHGGGPAATNWPIMLRFRYRLTDSQGKVVGGDGLPGKVFEQVVKVKRD